MTTVTTPPRCADGPGICTQIGGQISRMWPLGVKDDGDARDSDCRLEDERSPRREDREEASMSGRAEDARSFTNSIDGVLVDALSLEYRAHGTGE